MNEMSDFEKATGLPHPAEFVDKGKHNATMHLDQKVQKHEPMLQFFEFAHLPPHLQTVSVKFYETAQSLVALTPHNPERTVALRKLLEAKDCAVRALIYKP